VISRPGILWAAPGTTCPEARVGYDRIGQAAARRFPGVEQRWACTSAGIRRKLATQGSPVKDPTEALAAMRADGFTQVAVVSLHLTDGMEFGELAEAVAGVKRQRGNPMKLALGHALLTCEAEWLRTLKAVMESLPLQPGDPDRILLVAHGSRDAQALKTLRMAAGLCPGVDRRLILGMMLGTPGLDEVVRECVAGGAKKVWVLPCMGVAGFSARDDIAGPGEGSWVTALTRVGIEAVPVIKGLGEIDGVVEIWLEQVGRLLAETESES